MRRRPGRPAREAPGFVLLVDDDLLLCEIQQGWLEDERFDVHTVHDGEACLLALTETLPDVICLDLSMPGMDGFETLRRVKAHHPHIPVIVLTAQAAIEPAVEAMKLGAYDFLVKPIDRTKLATEVRNAVRHARLTARVTELERDAGGRSFPGIVGTSPRMRALYQRLDRVAPSDVTVLIHGESGSGKELVAQAIHAQSSRHSAALVALSCAAIPESLQESELFGHEKGAFTGATARRSGCFERADKGTLFLDEIGELTPSLQAKLLRVLQERSFQRVGGSSDIHSDFRLIAATNRDLAGEVQHGRFREDLYYRVAVIEIEVPSLRDRREDIAELVEHFVAAGCRDADRPPLVVHPDALEKLKRHDWPGNVRELQNAVAHAVVEAGSGGTITVAHLPQRVRGSQKPAERRAHAIGAANPRPDGDEATPVQTLDDIERQAIVEAVARANGNMSQVIRDLGIGRTTLYRKLKKYGLR